MRIFISVIGVLASLVLVGSSASMNYLFMYSIGKTELNSQVLSAASMGADVLKSLLPLFLSWGYLNRRYVFTVLAGGLFLALVGLSLLSASSFILGSRIAVSGTQDELNADYKAAQADLRGATAAFDALPVHRARNLVSADLERAKRSRRWRSSGQCSNATVQASIRFCEGVTALQTELKAVVERGRLDLKINRLKQEIARLRDAGAGQDGDPQIGLMSRVFNVERDGMALWLNVFIAIVIEAGAALGIFFATGWGAKEARKIGRELKPAAEARELSAEAVSEALATYCLDRLHPAQGRRKSVAVMDIYADYVAWSEKRGDAAGTVTMFLESFGEIAESAGLTVKGKVCQNVRIGDRLSVVA